MNYSSQIPLFIHLTNAFLHRQLTLSFSRVFLLLFYDDGKRKVKESRQLWTLFPCRKAVRKGRQFANWKIRSRAHGQCLISIKNRLTLIFSKHLLGYWKPHLFIKLWNKNIFCVFKKIVFQSIQKKIIYREKYIFFEELN